MTIVFLSFTILTGILHCMFFKLESLDFMKTKTLRKFGLSEKQGEVVRIWAFNQGFYNLFLALGLFFAIYLFQSGGSQPANVESGIMIARVILLSIIGAGAVLFASAPQKYPAALIQAVPALIAFASSFGSNLGI